ncbi:MAG: hypothetical protein V3S60_01415, partial [Acidimicrobiia bacterium]
MKRGGEKTISHKWIVFHEVAGGGSFQRRLPPVKVPPPRHRFAQAVLPQEDIEVLLPRAGSTVGSVVMPVSAWSHRRFELCDPFTKRVSANL